MAVSDYNTMIDETYEYSAPQFFDFIDGETEEEMRKAELWFENGLSYAPSPFMPKIKIGRSVQIEALCDFGDTEVLEKIEGSSSSKIASTIIVDTNLAPEADESKNSQSDFNINESTKVDETIQPKEESEISHTEEVPVMKPCEDKVTLCGAQGKESVSPETVTVVETKVEVKVETSRENEENRVSPVVSVIQGTEVCTPKPQTILKKEEHRRTGSRTTQTAKKLSSSVRNPSAVRPPRSQWQLPQAKGVMPTTVKSASAAKTVAKSAAKKPVNALDFSQENQAIKRQKLEGGNPRQILNIKSYNLPHKSKPGGATNMCLSSSRTRKEDRKVYVREAAEPFVSFAEMVGRFQSSTRDLARPHPNGSVSHEDAAFIIQRKAKLTLTRPREPEFETSQRVRAVRMKSSAELEEEMMANMPKFKARPVNKKILEAPTLPALPRSMPQQPEFKEFHLKTMERASQHDETSTVASSTESSHQSQWNPHKLTEPKMPRLETLLRARPPKVKTSEELEQEELEKMPKFKARPLNKKIFESKGEMGIYCNTKRHVTIPEEFHFATDERIPPPPTAVADLFDKLSLNSEPRHDHQIPRLTTPNPFHLHTEERGAEKERRLMEEILQKQIEEERARVPRATPYPYTTDYPVIPPKPEPKQCTKPEPFQLESLVRHEEELQREMEERQRMEQEEAQMRIFKAQPILKEDPLPVPEKVRRPLTQVEEFALHVDHRAVDREKFDKKVKEKETIYKRYREECESARQMEEEKALKQLRRTLVPHARPVPKFDNPFHPQKSSKETTKPKSPKLRVLQRNRKNMAGETIASCAAASNMR